MQYPPTAPELLTALADLLETRLLPALPPELRHEARVGAHLARMLERELSLDAAPEFDATAVPEERWWAALVSVVRADLAVAKPGYDAWEGE
ncbi:hypothetical protein D7D52_31080 [Nocardia yunnanensis]|uniref:Aminoglycoside phosphotransferase n=1 Tax=Nocardia yunnanensis TaxID=2382165 RepID=A0A386ZLL0_9NOCA|nr:hypothetical protein [Nocardia yunnanensis]AYF77519.1 hypothetical protein D7D52_31080 [Nocardia yunnanensis]